jgi:palmitoyltransferase ZDHHC3/7/25
MDICGIVCASITQGLLLYGSFATTRYVILPWMKDSLFAYINAFFFNLCVVIAMYSHIKTMTTNPGAVPHSALPLEDDQDEVDHEANMKLMPNLETFKKTCRRCHAFKPVRAHHCSICGRCVVKMVIASTIHHFESYQLY